MLNELKMRIFLDLAETLSFTETAKNMFVSQQSVSKHIADLEQDVGHKLFDRSSREVTLTTAGLECQRIFSRFIGDMTHITSASNDMVSQYKPIRAGFITYNDYGEEIAVAMRQLQREYPQLGFSISRYNPEMLNKLLLAGSLDFVLSRKRYTPSFCGVRSIDIRSFRTVLIVAANHPILETPDVDLACAGLPLVFERFDGEPQPETVARAQKELTRYNLNCSDLLIVPNRDSVFLAMEMGFGLLLTSEMSIPFCCGRVHVQQTKYVETSVLLWNNEEKRRFVERYAEILRDEYRKSFSARGETSLYDIASDTGIPSDY